MHSNRHMLEPRIRVFRRFGDDSRSKQREIEGKTIFHVRDLAVVQSRETVRVTRVAFRPHRSVLHREDLIPYRGDKTWNRKKAPPKIRARDPTLYIYISREVIELSNRFLRACDMTRTKNATTGNGDVVVVAPAKKSLVRVGRYQMLGPLGKGNFARVEEAIHTVLGVKVSVINTNRRRVRATARESLRTYNATLHSRERGESLLPRETDINRSSRRAERNAIVRTKRQEDAPSFLQTECVFSA